MTDVRIQDIKLNIEWKGRIAGNWDEITPQFLKKLAPVLLSRILTPAEQRLRCFKVLMNVPFWHLKLHWLLWWFSDELEDSANQAEFLFQDILLKKWLYSRVFCAGRIYFAPENGFSGMPLIQFCGADTYYLQWVKARSDESLHKLVATLYNPSKKYFDENGIADRANTMRRLPHNIKLAILVNFIGYRTHFIKFFPEVFKEKEEGETGSSSLTWADFIADLAERPEDVKKVKLTESFAAFLWLQRTVIRNREMEEKKREEKSNA